MQQRTQQITSAVYQSTKLHMCIKYHALKNNTHMKPSRKGCLNSSLPPVNAECTRKYYCMQSTTQEEETYFKTKCRCGFNAAQLARFAVTYASSFALCNTGHMRSHAMPLHTPH